MDFQELQEVGLTRSERQIYLALLKLGSSKSGKITKEVTQHRSRVYESLNRLIEKGLVSYVIKNNVKSFEAAPPERLLTYLEEKKAELEEKEKRIQEVIPRIKQETSPTKPEAEAHVLTGKEGFKTMRKDVLREKKDLYLIGGKGKEDKVMKYFFPSYNKLRIKSKIKFHVLFDHELRDKAITSLPLMRVKFLPPEYSTPTVINVYGDRVVSVLWKGDYPLCFMIKNKDIADSYRTWFDFLWKKAEK